MDIGMKNYKTSVLFIVIISAFALVLTTAGCGGGGGGGSTSSDGGGSTTGTAASLSIDQSSPAIFEGDTLQLTATPRDSGGNVINGQTLTWTSSAPNVASVDNNGGLVTGMVPGKATITASSGSVTSSGVEVTVSQLGVLKESVNFTGPYPAAGTVQYTNTSGTPTTIQGYPGQVVLYFNVSGTGGTTPSAISQREANIARNNGTVIEKIPLIGFYLVKVTAGQENTFIQAMLSGGYGVDVAVPNGASVRGASTPVFIGETTLGKYVPLNVGGGIVILDDFNLFEGENHGNDVYQTAINKGGVVSAKVQLPVSPDGSVPNDKIIASVAAIQQGAAIFSPGQNVTTNLSFNAGGEDGYASLWYSDNWKILASAMDATLKSVRDQLPESQKNRFMLVQEIGNSGQDISSAYKTIYDAETNAGLLGNHLFVGGSDGSYATQVNDPAYHEKAAWYPGCIAPGKCGSSFASPAVAAFIDQVARQANIPLDQARTAVLQALIAKPNGSPSEIIAAALSSANASGTYAGSFNGSGTFARPFPEWGTTCFFGDTFSGNMSLTFTLQSNGTYSGSVSVSGNFVSTAEAGSTPSFTCLNSSTPWESSNPASGTLPNFAFSTSFMTPGGTTVTGRFTGTLSGNSITGTMIITMDTSTGSASMPVTLTKR
jgi:hypothetical protein